MKFIFFGTPRFAEIFLSHIAEKGFTPTLVVTNPDRPAGRKKEMTPPRAKVAAENLGIPVFQDKPETMDVEHGVSFGVVAAYGGIIPESVIGKFPKGIIGVHPSLLPLLRGAAPIQTAILEEMNETGVSLFLLDEKVDHGPVIAQKKVTIESDDDYLSLEEKLAKAGAGLFSETAEQYLQGDILPEVQDGSRATYTKKFSREEAFIPEEELARALAGRDAERVSAKIRAFSAEPGAWTIKNGKQVKLLECAVQEGKLVLKRIQYEGKNSQSLNSSASSF